MLTLRVATKCLLTFNTKNTSNSLKVTRLKQHHFSLPRFEYYLTHHFGLSVKQHSTQQRFLENLLQFLQQFLDVTFHYAKQ